MNHSANLISLFDLYCAVTKRSESRVSTLALNGGHRVGAVRNGAGFTVTTYERAVSWFSEHWPTGVEWPDGIERPAGAAKETMPVPAAVAAE